MQKNNNLIEELNKMMVLTGIKKTIIEEDESKSNVNQDINHSQEEENLNKAKQEFNKESENEIKKIKNEELNYINTQEKDFLSFPMKISMLVKNKDVYMKLMRNIIELLYLQKAIKFQLFNSGVIDNDSQLKIKNSQILKEISEILIPEFSSKDISSIENLLKLIYTNVIKKSKNFLEDKIKKVNLGTELEDFKKYETQIKYLESIGAYDELQSLIKKEETLRKSFSTGKTDQKATISYKFNANKNDFKLRPLGFWQIQFLSRVASNKPKDELEEILMQNKKYIGTALMTLKDFYYHALFPIFTILTGRKFNIHPNDTEFKIMQDSGWDKVVDGVIKGSYDTTKNNFGTWAITVAKNAVIDEIKAITNIEFITTDNKFFSFI